MLSTPQNSPPEAALAQRLAALRQRIADAARVAGRDVDSITLLAVSKGQETGTLRAALALGIREFGENYLDEALPKIEALRSGSAKAQSGASGAGVAWHFIGRLQANKTRLIAEHFDWVHGVDRWRIAERLSGQRPHHAPPLNVCVQVNIAGEAAKGGVAPADAPELLRQVASLPGLRLRGLMGMLPFEMPVAGQRQAFAALRMIREQANAAGLPLDTLSMGMSGDFEQAIAEGATIVRIGTALFGPRA
jgi:pyridoxal phosphate enzyme (YggS family)